MADHRARTLRNRPTDAEAHLWRALRTLEVTDTHFRRQVPIGPYVVDFCCHGAKLIVEVDGGQHTFEVDAERTAWLESQGYRVVRFWNNEVLSNTEGVVAAINAQLQNASKS